MLIILIITIIIIVYLINSNYQYWVKRGVPGPKPTFLIGNLQENILLRKSLPVLYSDFYKKFQETSIVGIFRATTPSLIIRDPDLIKDITVKSFHHFRDNDLSIDLKVDPLVGRNPFFSKGEVWKNARVHLTQGFTSGKMKTVYPLLEDVSKKFVNYIEQYLSEIDVRDLCKRFTLNNVGTCAFGLDAKCFEEENPEFKQIADRFLTPEGWQSIKLLIISIVPLIKKYISIRFTPVDVEERLTNIVGQALKYREENNIVRNDFLHVLTQLSKNHEDFTEIDIVAHAAGFFIDGYETSSIVMHFLLFELAANPEAQSKLREEINKTFDRNGNTLPYEELQKMVYLDAAFNESMRLHPALGSLNRVCTKPYTFIPRESDPIEKPFVIEPETPIILPLYALHRDPKYFVEPDLFKPERFLNKDDIPKFTFLPFGEGPRACLGRRFGAMQVKIGIAYIVKNFEISVNEKTRLPIEYDPVYFLTLPKNSLWLKFKKN